MSKTKGSKRPFGNTPSRLKWYEQRVWRELVHASVPGVLQPSDRVCFEMLVKLASKLYMGQPIGVGERKVLTTLSTKFGMTPGDRKMIVDRQAQSQWVTSETAIEEENQNHGL